MYEAATNYRRRMKRVLILTSLLALLALALALPAAAEHNAEHVQQETQRLQNTYLPPGVGPLMSLYGVDAFGVKRTMSLHDLAYTCYSQGGYYYYYADDGGWYWNVC